MLAYLGTRGPEQKHDVLPLRLLRLQVAVDMPRRREREASRAYQACCSVPGSVEDDLHGVYGHTV